MLKLVLLQVLNFVGGSKYLLQEFLLQISDFTAPSSLLHSRSTRTAMFWNTYADHLVSCKPYTY